MIFDIFIWFHSFEQADKFGGKKIDKVLWTETLIMLIFSSPPSWSVALAKSIVFLSNKLKNTD